MLHAPLHNEADDLLEGPSSTTTLMGRDLAASEPAPPGDTEPSVSDADLDVLMERYVDGDERAFAELHARLVPRLRSRLGKLVRDRAAVDDLVQLTFMRAHQVRDRFSLQLGRPDRAVEGWYLAIARNVALDHLRHQYRRDRRHATLEARGDIAGLGASSEPMLTPEDLRVELERSSEQARRVRAAIAQLPPGQREVVQLHKLRGLSMSEIAERLQVRPGALRVRAHRAYKALASLILMEGSAEPPAIEAG